MEDGRRYLPGRLSFGHDSGPDDWSLYWPLAVHPAQRRLQRLRRHAAVLGRDASAHEGFAWLASPGTTRNDHKMNPKATRREFLKTGSALACGITLGGCAMTPSK